MTYLKTMYGDSAIPSKNIMRELVTHLSYVYPVMFRESEGNELKYYLLSALYFSLRVKLL